jgi:hypothetical protein
MWPISCIYRGKIYYFRRDEMRKYIACLVTGVILLFSAVVSNATILNFDDLSGWGTVPVNYGGLTWNDSWWSFTSEPPYYPAYSDPRVVTSFDNMNGISWTGLNYVDFPTASIFNGAYFSGWNTIGYDLYYHGSKVASTPDVDNTHVSTFIASNYSGLVDRVFIRGSQSYFAMDNFTFNENSSQVPEPTTMLLLGLGLMGVAGVRRKFKK